MIFIGAYFDLTSLTIFLLVVMAVVTCAHAPEGVSREGFFFATSKNYK